MTAKTFDEVVITRHAEMLANRCARALRRWRGHFERQNIGAFRLYDWDIPELRVVVDWYEGHVVLGEYAREQTAGVPYLEALGCSLARALGLPDENVHLRTRRGSFEGAEGLRNHHLAAEEARVWVREGALKFHVWLDEYPDVGLFPGHRKLRARVRTESSGRAVLNLFAYTGAFTVYAADGGARGTTSVDLSGRYLARAQENLHENLHARPGFDPRKHAFVREDAVAFVERSVRAGLRWGLIVLDVPSFSPVGGDGDFQVVRDHGTLLRAARALLERDGVLYFSTSHQDFTPGFDGETELRARELTAETVPEDYRHKTVHRCWRITAEKPGADLREHRVPG